MNCKGHRSEWPILSWLLFAAFFARLTLLTDTKEDILNFTRGLNFWALVLYPTHMFLGCMLPPGSYYLLIMGGPPVVCLASFVRWGRVSPTGSSGRQHVAAENPEISTVPEALNLSLESSTATAALKIDIESAKATNLRSQAEATDHEPGPESAHATARHPWRVASAAA